MRSPLSTRALADWLEKQPPAQGYSYINSDRCCIAQYLTAVGFKQVGVNAWWWHAGSRWRGDYQSAWLPKHWNDIALGKTFAGSDRTFGDALKRARGFLKAEALGLA